MLVCDGNGSGECSNKMIIFYYIKRALIIYFFFFFNDPAPPEIYPLPLHDALPICLDAPQQMFDASDEHIVAAIAREVGQAGHGRTTVVIGENEPQDSRLARPPQRGGDGPHALWQDDFYHSAMGALTGRREGYYNHYRRRPSDVVPPPKNRLLYSRQRFSSQQ